MNRENSFPKSITKDQLQELPIKQFEGKKIIISSEEKVRKAIEEISYQKVVGFDTEAKPTFKKGDYNHISLVQIAIPDKVYLFRIKYTGLLKYMTRLFSSPKILKIGIGVKDDIRGLQKLKPFEAAGFVDLNEIALQLGFENTGAKNLSGIFLGYRISKRQQLSNWEEFKLTEPQLNYAATDAFICLEIYQKMIEHDMIKPHA